MFLLDEDDELKRLLRNGIMNALSAVGLSGVFV